MQNREWAIPQLLTDNYGEICQQIMEILIADQEDDELVWQGPTNGEDHN